MFKGDLIKKSDGWAVIYSRPNIGKISEIALDQASINLIVMKYGSRIKFLPNMNFVIAEGCAVVKFEEQEKQKASKKLRELYDTPLELKYNPPIIDNSPIIDKAPFSTGEELTMKHLVSAYEEFFNLEQRQPSDTTDFVFHIHALQRILGQRVLRRDYPNTFPTHK
jgi:hypothetical protein